MNLGAQMNRLVKIIFFLVYIGWSPLVFSAKSSDDYLKYVSEITKEFSKEMEKKHRIYCSGDGGRMPRDVEEVEVWFTVCRKTSVEEARILEVDLIENLLKKINSHEKIRPYLREYPFPSERVGIVLSFESERGADPLDESVAFVCTGKGKIHYKKAMMVMEHWGPVYDARQDLHNPVCIKPARDVLIERLRPILSEPYEEALKLVKGAQEQKNAPKTGK